MYVHNIHNDTVFPINPSRINYYYYYGLFCLQDQFENTFSVATIHDMFNFLTILVLMPVEMASNLLLTISQAMVDALNIEASNSTQIKLFSALTDPMTNLIVRIDENALVEIAEDKNGTSRHAQTKINKNNKLSLQ